MSSDPTVSSEAIEQTRALQIALEEYRQVVEERRFVMTRYVQAIGLYLALAGFGLKELIAAPSEVVVWLLSALFTALNTIALYAAQRFKSMAMHAINREITLAQRLQVQGPHSLIWGYAGGVLTVLLFELAIVLIAVFRWYHLINRATSGRG